MNPPELVLDSTCIVCQSILGTALPSRERSIDKSSALLRPNALALLKSSRTGCHLCNLILGNWFPSVDKWPDGLDAVHLMAKTDHFRDIIVTFEDEPPSYNFEGPFNYLNIHLLGSQDVHCYHRPISDSTSSEETIRRVKVWLKACQQNHPLCKFEPASPPTRLVELVSEAHGFRLRLVETLTSLAVCQYVTLSYCWGVDPFLRLTRENYASFVEEIPLAELPKTLSDAVIFAKMLQIRFIWIDALCIIQDSPEDWAHEAASMSDVYSGGLLNISAVASESVNGGLFRFRNPLAISPFLSGVGNEPSGNFERVYVSGRPYEEYHNNPLSKRGWCLQERLLAQRTVHFTHTSIVWECNECTEPEASLSSLARFALKPLEDIKTKQMMVSPSVRTYSPDKQDITSVQKLWHDWKIIVSLYAATQLTYQKDKLVAISGVARRFEQLHSKCGGDYLAGLWQADLISGLLWSTYDETLEKAVRHKSNTAPSWSWASVDGPIHWERNVHYSTIWQASIFEASTNTDGDDFSGPISDGIVSIRGPLGMASLSKTAIVSVLADRRNEPAYPAELNGHTVHGTSLIPDDHSAPALEELQNTTLYLLGLSESKHNGQSVNQRRIEGLLLTPDRAKTGRFSRVGYFKYQKPDTAKGSKTRIDDFPLASLSKHLYEQYHARLDGENQYTIRIC